MLLRCRSNVAQIVTHWVHSLTQSDVANFQHKLFKKKQTKTDMFENGMMSTRRKEWEGKLFSHGLVRTHLAVFFWFTFTSTIWSQVASRGESSIFHFFFAYTLTTSPYIHSPVEKFYFLLHFCDFLERIICFYFSVFCFKNLTTKRHESKKEKKRQLYQYKLNLITGIKN